MCIRDRNTVAPGVGTTLYWQDMFLDSYKNSLSEGHDNIKSIAYAIANTGLEYATGKFLGSATKGLTGGNTNELTNALSNVANKITKNPKVASVLGSMGSEAVSYTHLSNVVFLWSNISTLNVWKNSRQTLKGGTNGKRRNVRTN